MNGNKDKINIVIAPSCYKMGELLNHSYLHMLGKKHRFDTSNNISIHKARYFDDAKKIIYTFQEM